MTGQNHRDRTNIHIRNDLRDKLRVLAAQHGLSMTKMLDRIIAEETKGIRVEAPER